MLVRILILTMLVLSLVGCAEPPREIIPHVDYYDNNAQISLAKAATSVSESLNQLAAIERASKPKLRFPTPPNPASIGMAQIASIDWTGPIEPILKEIAKKTHYHLSILGRKPAIPIIIALREENLPIAEILRDISLQAVRHANVVVYPRRRIIELRYHHV